MRKPSLAVLAAAIMTAAAAQADIVIDGVDAHGGASRVTIGAGKARIDAATADTHTLIDLDTRRVLAVEAHAGFAMDLGSPRQERSEHARMAAAGLTPPEVQLEDAGPGPDIAGYPTRHYHVLVNGVHCHDEYLAAAPLAQADLRRFIEVLAAASDDRDNRVLTQLAEPERLCEVSDDLIDDHYPRLGIPLRSVARDGALLHEITRIRLDAPAQPALFELPADYPVLTRAQVSERQGDGGLDAAAVAEKQRRIQERMEDIERRSGAAQTPVPLP